MELQRTILLGIFCALTFMLWSTWQQEHLPTRVQADVASSTTQIPTSALASKQQPIAGNKAVQAPAQRQASSKRVHVVSDVLELWLDTRGGQIVRAQLKKYPQSQQKSDTPLTLLSSSADRLYVAESGLLGREGPDHQQQAALYQADRDDYVLPAGDESMSVVMTWRDQKRGLEINKIFTLTRDSYQIKVDYEIKNTGNATWAGHWYAQLKRRDVESSHKSFNTFFGAAVSSDADPYQKISFSDIEDAPLAADHRGGWAAMVEHYFLSAWVPEPDKKYHYYTRALPNNVYSVGMVSSEIQVPALAQKRVSSTFYVGPAIMDKLEAVAPNLKLTVDFGILWFISVVLFWVMKKIHLFLGNWGWSIIGVTVIIKLIFYRLSAKSYRSMARLRQLQPRIEQLKERFGDDKQGFTKAMMGLYKQEKANPLGGCLPILVQIPVFIALYWVLLDSVELRQAPFVFWIHDLSSKDPFYVLPLLMGLSMVVQQRMSPPPADPTQAKVMMLMPIIFTVFFLTFPSGLVLYWLVNNTLSILQQWWINRCFSKPKSKSVSVSNKTSDA